MEKELGQNDPEISRYFDQLLQPEDSILAQVKSMATKLGLPDIHVARYDGRHIEVIVRSLNIHKAVEIGTLAGYSGICILRGLLNPKRLYTFEFNPKHVEVANSAFALAGYSKDVEIFTGAALENLAKIESQGPFDLVFIDADKLNYCNYFDWAKRNLKVGGVILADNTFAWGQIAKPTDDKTVRALQNYNQLVASDKNFLTTILPTNEGLTFSVKIS